MPARQKSAAIIARQEARAAERSLALADRVTQLLAVAPSVDWADIKYLAINCGTRPTFDVVLRALAAAKTK